MTKKFKQYAANIGIIIKNCLIEAHYSIGLIEYYQRPLRQIYSIITTEIPGIEPNSAF